MQQPRKFLFGVEARKAIFGGIQLLNNTTSVTLGPAGRCVSMHMGKQIVLTSKDGITVAEQVSSPDSWEQVGIQIAREASDKCNDDSGDGTTSAIVFTHDLCKQALHLPSDANVIKIKKGIEKAVDACVEELKKLAISCKKKEDFRKVAFISSQDDEIADKVTEVFMQSGEHGAIDTEYSETPGLRAEHTDGFVIEEGSMINFSQKVIFENIPVLVTDKDIKTSQQILPIMEILAQKGLRKLFIVCDRISDEAKAVISNNINANKFIVCPVKCPSFGKYRIEVFRDICAVTGATFVSEEENVRLDKVEFKHLGSARRVTVEHDKTIIISDETVEIKKRVSDKITELEELQKTELDDIVKEEVKKRLATLTNGVSVIKFGARTEGERHEKKHRIEDAIRATESAREEGIVMGGGSAYLRCIPVLEALECDDKDEKMGVEMVKKALRCITMRVLEVGGVDDRELIVSKIIEKGGNAGYDFKTGNIEDMVKLGVIEPAKVDRCVIENAASCAKTFLSTELGIVDADPEPLEKLASAMKA